MMTDVSPLAQQVSYNLAQETERMLERKCEELGVTPEELAQTHVLVYYKDDCFGLPRIEEKGR